MWHRHSCLCPFSTHSRLRCGTDTLVCAVFPLTVDSLRLGIVPRDDPAVYVSPGIIYRRNLPHIVQFDRPVFITFTTLDWWVLPPCARNIALPVRAGIVKSADEYPWLWRSWIEGAQIRVSVPH